jgi:predicted RNA-binding protein with TRAM domain|uniref:TRAM domain-containing protein n=1 Tax=Fervidicoccus fontis TaxID=683846 RepID=A0A7J3SKX6_9CREN
MVVLLMTKYRDHKEVYTRDYSRWSVYPKIPKPDEFGPHNKVYPGAVVTLEISDIDEKGRGVGLINKIKIHVNGGCTVGDKVKAKIIEKRGEEALADLLEVLK